MFSCEKNTKVTSEKPVQIDYRKYDPTGSYKTNPIDGNLIKKEINANSDISLIANKIKIEGNRKDIRKLTPPKSFTLNDPTLIKTNGLIQLPLDSSTIKTRAFDTAQLKKTKLRLNLKEGLNSQQKKGAKIATNLTKVKRSKISNI